MIEEDRDNGDVSGKIVGEIRTQLVGKDYDNDGRTRRHVVPASDPQIIGDGLSCGETKVG